MKLGIVYFTGPPNLADLSALLRDDCILFDLIAGVKDPAVTLGLCTLRIKKKRVKEGAAIELFHRVI